MNVAELEVGREIPPYSRETGFEVWNRFAAVNYEFVPIHMDDEAGKKAGQAGAIGMGRLQWSYLHILLTDWLGDDGRVVRIGAQFRSPNLKGMTLTAKGKITAVRTEQRQTLVDLDIWIEDGEGKTIAPGTATVAIA